MTEDECAAHTGDVAGAEELRENTFPPGWRNPEPSGTYDLVIIGAGPAGLFAARGAATLGRRVALIERQHLGGNCLNVGCVPSKALICTSRLYARMREAAELGVPRPPGMLIDVRAAMQRIRRLQSRLSRVESAHGLREHGVDVYFGAGSFIARNRIAVAGAVLRFKKALIASGARPMPPAIPGLIESGYWTNEDVFDVTAAPRRLLVIGGGPLGCELAQAFCRLGSQVIIAQDDPMFLPGRSATPRRYSPTPSLAMASRSISTRRSPRSVNRARTSSPTSRAKMLG